MSSVIRQVTISLGGKAQEEDRQEGACMKIMFFGATMTALLLLGSGFGQGSIAYGSVYGAGLLACEALSEESHEDMNAVHQLRYMSLSWIQGYATATMAAIEAKGSRGGTIEAMFFLKDYCSENPTATILDVANRFVWYLLDAE
ncbi:hypothetical protein [Desulfurivibrio sp. C05AmB]|uniref:hypothetical protein n=1 Tax=Desulfurivibrio sp. C05AmB TaxID=3374371 RepID=UPI00376EAE01